MHKHAKTLLLQSLLITSIAHPVLTSAAENDSKNKYTIDSTHYFSTRADAEKALAGYNYALTLLKDGRIEAIVSGLNGSGAQNAITVSDVDSQPHQEATLPIVNIGMSVNGQQAIDVIGDNLSVIAQSYDMSPERLKHILKTDQSAWFDKDGRLFYMEAGNNEVDSEYAANGATASNASGDTFLSMTSSLDVDPFMLHSKPGSNRVIYLDFNGHAAVNSAWYSGTLTAATYDIDGDASAFSAAELNNIKEIWQRVAEDYAPFDVDVTTQEPASDAINRTSYADAQYGSRAVITRSIPQICSQSCGGVAYVNVFSYYSSSKPDYYQPAWVFLDKLGNGNPKYVAEAISHEIGHNLNLNHDGTSSAPYYSGHGVGATGWAPIMGVGYYKPVTQWSKGEYPDANNYQDDITVISAAGASLRADDYPDTPSNAAPLSGKSNEVAQSGVIERSTDKDVFVFQSGSGEVNFTVASGVIASGGNLDINLKLTDLSGGVIASSNPSNSLSASIIATLPAGNYFLHVEGAGYGDTNTGYSNYASLGQYLITGSYPEKPATLLPPSADISALPVFGDAPLSVSFSGTRSSDQDGSIVSYDWDYGDGFFGNNTVNPVHIYNLPGTYTAKLTVTDNDGLKSSSTQTIDVTQSMADLGIKIKSITVSKKSIRNGYTQCMASIKAEHIGSAMQGVKITGSWSGSIKTSSGYKVIKGSSIGVTDALGAVNIDSTTLPSASSGTCAFTVTSVTKSGYTYDGVGPVSSSFTW